MKYKSKSSYSGSLAGCVALLVLVAGTEAFLAWVAMALWDSVVRTIFVGAPVVDFWFGLGIVIVIDFVAFFFKSKQ